MPLYEYRCEKCASKFEILVRGDEAPACPQCGSAKVGKQFSTFAAHTNGAPAQQATPMGCGKCGDPRGPGACQMS